MIIMIVMIFFMTLCANISTKREKSKWWCFPGPIILGTIIWHLIKGASQVNKPVSGGGVCLGTRTHTHTHTGGASLAVQSWVQGLLSPHLFINSQLSMSIPGLEVASRASGTPSTFWWQSRSLISVHSILLIKYKLFICGHNAIN